MNKQDIVNLLTVDGSLPLGLSHKNAEAAVNSVFTNISAALALGEEVKISGFGTFKRVATQARTCRNPHNGAAVEVPAGHKIKFKASSRLKE